jgi:hypothetical protein
MNIGRVLRLAGDFRDAGILVTLKLGLGSHSDRRPGVRIRGSTSARSSSSLPTTALHPVHHLRRTSARFTIPPHSSSLRSYYPSICITFPCHKSSATSHLLAVFRPHLSYVFNCVRIPEAVKLRGLLPPQRHFTACCSSSNTVWTPAGRLSAPPPCSKWDDFRLNAQHFLNVLCH